MVKPTVRKKMKKIEELFSVVARNPELEIPEEKWTLKKLAIRALLSQLVAFILSLPLTLIACIRLFGNKDKDCKFLYAYVSNYSSFDLLL